MKIQRIVKHGDSLAVIIPAEMRREVGFNRGDYIRLEYITNKENPFDGYGLALWKVKPEPIKSR